MSKSESSSLAERLRRAALVVPFAVLLLIPKALHLRRRRTLWNALRIGVGAAAIWILIQSFTIDSGVALTVTGCLLLALAAIARPARTGKTLDGLRRSLGGLVTVNGGLYLLPNGSPENVHLIVGPTQFHIINGKLQPIDSLPLASLSRVRLEPEKQAYHLVLNSSGRELVFRYEGQFAQHLASVAESTLQGVRRSALTVLR